MARPKSTPRKVTVSLAQHHAEELQKLAKEAGVSMSTLCAHVLERYAIQDRAIMTNDVITQRLEQTLDQHTREFHRRFTDLLIRTAHEVTAHRRAALMQTEVQEGREAAKDLQEVSWQAAVKTLRPHTQRLTNGEDEAEPTSS